MSAVSGRPTADKDRATDRMRDTKNECLVDDWISKNSNEFLYPIHPSIYPAIPSISTSPVSRLLFNPVCHTIYTTILIHQDQLNSELFALESIKNCFWLVLYSAANVRLSRQLPELGPWNCCCLSCSLALTFSGCGTIRIIFHFECDARVAAMDGWIDFAVKELGVWGQFQREVHWFGTETETQSGREWDKHVEKYCRYSIVIIRHRMSFEWEWKWTRINWTRERDMHDDFWWELNRAYLYSLF